MRVCMCKTRYQDIKPGDTVLISTECDHFVVFTHGGKVISMSNFIVSFIFEDILTDCNLVPCDEHNIDVAEEMAQEFNTSDIPGYYDGTNPHIIYQGNTPVGFYSSGHVSLLPRYTK